MKKAAPLVCREKHRENESDGTIGLSEIWDIIFQGSDLRRSSSRAGEENTEERDHHHITVLKQQQRPERNNISLAQNHSSDVNGNYFKIQYKHIPEWPTKCQPKETQQGNDAAHDSVFEDFYPLKLEVKQMSWMLCLNTGTKGGYHNILRST